MLVIINSAYCQGKNEINLTIKSMLRSDAAHQIIKQGLLLDDPVTIKFDSKKKANIKIIADEPSFYKITDLYAGHLVFLSPADTFKISFQPIQHTEEKLNKGLYVPRLFKLIIEGKYPKNITFFDEFEDKFGMTLKYKSEASEIYLNKCNAMYEAGIQQLRNYEASGQISKDFIRYAIEELQARRLLWFCEMLSQRNIQNRLGAIADFQKKSFSDSSFAFASSSYLTAGAVYNYYIANNIDAKHYFNNLDNEYASILKNHKPGLLRDQLLTWQMQDYIGKKSPAFDSCYADYIQKCKSLPLIEQTKRKILAFRKPIVSASKMLSVEEIFKNTIVFDVKLKQHSLYEIIDDSLPTLIDCWATWCSPCIAQIPAMEKAESKYKGRMRIINLSFDKDTQKWQKSEHTKKDALRQFLVNDAFDGDFAAYFKVSLIPRYILFSKKNALKVLNGEVSKPSLVDDFDKDMKLFLIN